MHFTCQKYNHIHFSKNSKYNKLHKSAHFSCARYPRLWHKDLYPNKALPQTLVKVHQTFTFWFAFTKDNGIAKIKYVILMPQSAYLPTQHENTTIAMSGDVAQGIGGEAMSNGGGPKLVRLQELIALQIRLHAHPKNSADLVEKLNDAVL